MVDIKEKIAEILAGQLADMGVDPDGQNGGLDKDEIKGMVIVQPYLNENQTLKFTEEPELMVRLYEILPECTVPTAILEPENSPLSASKKATESMPDGRIVLFEGSLSKFDRFTFNNIDLKTLSALEDM